MRRKFIPILTAAVAISGLNCWPTSNIKAIEGATSTVANENVADLRSVSIDLSNGRIVLEAGLYDPEGRVWGDYILTSFDYEHGVTMAEADARLATLGEDTDYSWTNWTTTYTEQWITTPAWNRQVSDFIADRSPRENNKSGVIYYALKYENHNKPEMGAVWYRGKIDYRGCAHSSAKVCNAYMNSASDPIRFVQQAYSYPSWEEELKTMMYDKHLKETEVVVAELEQRRTAKDNTYLEDLPEAKTKFANAKQAVTDVHYDDLLSAELLDLADRLAVLEEPITDQPNSSEEPNQPGGDPATTDPTDQPGSTPGQGEDPGDNPGNTSGNDPANDPISRPTGGSMGGSTGGSTSVDNSTNHSADNSANGLRTGVQTGQIDQNWGENNLLASDFAGTNTGVETSATSDFSDDVLSQEMIYGDLSEDSIEVPNLGGEEYWVKKYLWAICILALAGLGSLLWFFLKKREEKDEDLEDF